MSYVLKSLNMISLADNPSIEIPLSRSSIPYFCKSTLAILAKSLAISLSFSVVVGLFNTKVSDKIPLNNMPAISLGILTPFSWNK